jgi:hypothetical protein
MNNNWNPINNYYMYVHIHTYIKMYTYMRITNNMINEYIYMFTFSLHIVIVHHLFYLVFCLAVPENYYYSLP